ncbi:LysR family transcriptional regulator [Siminovitchia fortis]|uniref:LysR family transcriptional regulator n=1 Tax=Siminovitchia fortis TaxID=254758 RepID=UPI0011A27D28|nr:LysR family transcriptional regulator [Siminovitchia fortis]
MDLHRLRCFIKIVEEGSVSKAAEALNMTQPPLSIMMAKLEKELKVSLFDRSGRRLTLTRDGEFLYVRGKELIASAENMVKELMEHNDGMRGTVTAGCITSANLFIIPDAVKKLREEAPNIIMRVKEGNSSFVLNELRNHRIDIGIVRTIFEAEDLHISTLMTEPLLLALPPGHPLLDKPSVSIADLRDEKFILPTSSHGSGIAEEIVEACHNSGFAPDVVYWGTEVFPMLFMVMKGVGISFAPYNFSRFHWPGLPELVPLAEPKLETKLSLVTLQHHYQPSIVERFLDITRDVAKELQPDI